MTLKMFAEFPRIFVKVKVIKELDLVRSNLIFIYKDIIESKEIPERIKNFQILVYCKCIHIIEVEI